MNVAVVPLYATKPGIAPSFRVNVVVVTDVAIIGSLNVAVMVEFIATPGAPLAGLTDETVGGVVSAGVPAPGEGAVPPPHAATEMLKSIASKNLIILMIISPYLS